MDSVEHRNKSVELLKQIEKNQRDLASSMMSLLKEMISKQSEIIEKMEQNKNITIDGNQIDVWKFANILLTYFLTYTLWIVKLVGWIGDTMMKIRDYFHYTPKKDIVNDFCGNMFRAIVSCIFLIGIVVSTLVLTNFIYFVDHALHLIK